MSVNLWAFDDIKCDGYPCPGDCDNCEVKEEHRCEECAHYHRSTVPLQLYGYCDLTDLGTSPVQKACNDFEEADE